MTRHPLITLIVRAVCKVFGMLFLIPGSIAFIRLLFIPPDDFPRQVLGLAMAATGGCAMFGLWLLRNMPAKGPPLRIGSHRH